MALDELKGATILPGEEKKVQAALDDLAKDPHAPRDISVRYTLHIHNEYPKHVIVGKDKDDQPIVKVVNSPEEEKAALASIPASPVADEKPVA